MSPNRQITGPLYKMTADYSDKTMTEELPSARMAIARARLHEGCGAEAEVVHNASGNLLYTTEDGVL